MGSRTGTDAAPDFLPVAGSAFALVELRESMAPAPAAVAAPSADETTSFAERLRAALALEAEPTAPTTATHLRESAFPLFAGYDLASLLRGAGTVWADAQATGSADDEADAASLAKTVKRVIDRHPEIVQLGDSCGCGPVCCC